jgi:hypothetical protein
MSVRSVRQPTNRVEGNARILGWNQYYQSSTKEEQAPRINFHEVENRPGDMRIICCKGIISIKYQHSSAFFWYSDIADTVVYGIELDRSIQAQTKISKYCTTQWLATLRKQKNVRIFIEVNDDIRLYIGADTHS